MGAFGGAEATLSLERAGLKGRTMTVVDGLQASEEALQDLTRRLKARCGFTAAVSVKGASGRLELVGDKRDILRAALQEEGIRCKG